MVAFGVEGEEEGGAYGMSKLQVGGQHLAGGYGEIGVGPGYALEEVAASGGEVLVCLVVAEGKADEGGGDAVVLVMELGIDGMSFSIRSVAFVGGRHVLVEKEGYFGTETMTFPYEITETDLLVEECLDAGVEGAELSAAMAAEEGGGKAELMDVGKGDEEVVE